MLCVDESSTYDCTKLISLECAARRHSPGVLGIRRYFRQSTTAVLATSELDFSGRTIVCNAPHTHCMLGRAERKGGSRNIYMEKACRLQVSYPSGKVVHKRDRASLLHVHPNESQDAKVRKHECANAIW